jgi:hypothetical protein
VRKSQSGYSARNVGIAPSRLKPRFERYGLVKTIISPLRFQGVHFPIVQGTVYNIVKAALAAVAGLLSLPALIFGSYLFSCWVRIHTADVFYVEYPYLLAAVVLGGIGALSAFCSIYGALRRSFYGLIFLIPIVLGLATMVYIPDGTPHVQRSMMDDTNYLSATGSFLWVWYEAHRRFPNDQAEFFDALRSGPAAWQNRVSAPPMESDYARGGARLPYQVVVLNGASGPRLTNLSQQPGVIYYCVTEDRQQFWLTMTGLHEDVSRGATLKTVADRPYDKPWLVTAAGKDYH